MSQYNDWHRWPTVARLSICGAASPLAKREKSSWTVLNMYSRRMKSNLLLTSRNGRRRFFSERLSCTLERIMPLSTSGGRLSMMAREIAGRDWVTASGSHKFAYWCRSSTATYCVVSQSCRAPERNHVKLVISV